MSETVSTADICLHCGVCCTGAMFSYVPFRKPGDRASLRRHGQEVGAEDQSFPLPCRFQVGAGCSIYHDRPHVCGAFRCRVLIEAQDGALPVDEAVTRAAELKRLYDDLRARMAPGESLPQMRDRVARLTAGDTSPQGEEATLVMAFYLFTAFMDRHFHQDARRQMEYMQPEG